MHLEDWVQAHIHSVLWVVEVLWVAGFVAVFVAYFILKRRFRKKKPGGAAQRQRVE